MKNDYIIRDLLESSEISVDLNTGNVYSNTVAETFNTDGYKRLQYKNKYTLSSHRVVAYVLWNDQIFNYEVNHINGNKADNRPENLELVTASQNCQHAYDTGLSVAVKGEKNGNAKLTQDQVDEIRELYATGDYTQKELGKLFGVCHQNISFIVNRKWWK